MTNKRYTTRKALPKRSALAVALAVGMGISGFAFGQATTGAIFGSAPQQTGETVVATSATGLSREVAVTNGQYMLNSLPVGTYTVTLKRNGEVVSTHKNVSIQVGGASAVNFSGTGANAQNLGAVQVSASALPSIDVTNVNSSTVVTAQQLGKLPIAHNASAIALLAPGTVKGSAYFGNYISFGGASVTENAYYVNGFNTTDPLSGFGGFTLPYGAIAQQQMLTGGYGAKYGRSDGGVISQVGKRGTNQWHFGGQVRWLPDSLEASPRSQYRPGGLLQNYNGSDTSWETQYSAYIGGPLIKDRLFFFAAAQFTKQAGSTVGSRTAFNKEQWQRENPEYYLKIDWNINDSNILELTGMRQTSSFSGQNYAYDYSDFSEGAFNSFDTHTKNTDKLWLAKYTSYITDNLTLTAMYGQLRHGYFNATPGYDPTYPHIFGPADANPNPLIPSTFPPHNTNTIGTFTDPTHTAKNTNLRIDLQWQLGNHRLTFGIDNQSVYDIHDGTTTSGPGYAWEYDQTPDANTYIVGGPSSGPDWQNKLWVEAPSSQPGGTGAGGKGYYAAKYIYQNSASVKVSQRAQYIQDDWQINDRWLVRIGLRNDQFTNYNPKGVAYLRLTSPQLSPRLGFTWDVNGDSSFKVYGNAGRYYLAMPASVALRSAGGSLYTRTYYTYEGWDANGIPKNLHPVNTSRGSGVPVSVNNEYGAARDPKTATSTNLTAEYQDEFIAGFDKKLNDSWTYGAKITYRILQNGIDDVGDKYAIAAKMVKLGLVTQAQSQALLAANGIPASILFNPTKTNIFKIINPAGGYYTVPMSMKDFGFTSNMKRKYWGLGLYLEHPFDGKYFVKISYLLSHSYGNSEGQVRSDIGQSDVSATVDWDYAQVMRAASGDLANDRRHQLKIYGAYQITPEWMASANLMVMSGMPRTCLGFYGTQQNNPGLGYGAYYHFCGGKAYPPGTQHNPWEYDLDLGVQYSPAFFQHRLKVSLNVQNVMNRQSVRQTYPQYAGGNPFWTSLNSDPMAISWTSPRTVALSVSYDY